MIDNNRVDAVTLARGILGPGALVDEVITLAAYILRPDAEQRFEGTLTIGNLPAGTLFSLDENMCTTSACLDEGAGHAAHAVDHDPDEGDDLDPFDYGTAAAVEIDIEHGDAVIVRPLLMSRGACMVLIDANEDEDPFYANLTPSQARELADALLAHAD